MPSPSSPLVLLGGILCHLTYGTLYCWGNTTTYLTSYLRLTSPEITTHDTLSVFSCALIGQALFMFCGGWMESKVGPRITSLLAISLLSFSALLSSVSTTLIQFTLTQTLFGIGIGIGYVSPIICGYMHYPESKGLVSGIVVAGFGAGSFIFNFVITGVVNPLGEDVGSDGYYSSDSSVVENVPRMYRVLALCYFVLGCMGSYLQLEYRGDDGSDGHKGGGVRKNTDDSTSLIPSSRNGSFDLNVSNSSLIQHGSTSTNTNTTIKRSTSSSSQSSQSSDGDASETDSDTQFLLSSNKTNFNTNEMLSTPLSYFLMLSMFCTACGGMYLSATYKSYGENFFYTSFVGGVVMNDKYYSVLGGVGSVFNAAGRVIWGVASDRYGVFNVMILNAVLFPVCFIAYNYSISDSGEGNGIVFGVLVCACFFIYGGNYSLLPSATGKLFGQKYVGKNYSAIFVPYGILTGIVLYVLGTTDIEYFDINWLIAIINIVGAFVVLNLRRIYVGKFEESGESEEE